MKRRFRTLSVFLSIIFIIPVMYNCGKKGPLTLDPLVLPKPISDFEVVQIGKNINFKWKFQSYLSDKTTGFDKSRINKIYLYFSERPVPSVKFRKRGKLLKKFAKEQLTLKGDYNSFELKGIYKKFLNKKIFIGIYYKYNKINSAIGKIKEITIINPVKPVSDLILINENKVIKLKWSRQNFDINNKRASDISGYDIYRKIVKNEEDKSNTYRKINSDIVIREYYEDSDTGSDGIYTYYVSTVISKINFSDNSNIVSVKIKDIFPPEIPLNLMIFKSDKGLVLSWTHVKDKDFSHYKIYRKVEGESEFSLLIPKEQDNKLVDLKVKKGKKYFYFVTAVDKNGNESDNSKRSFEEF